MDTSWPPPVIIHDLAGALTAAEAAYAVAVGLHLRTGAGAAAYLGIDWFQVLERELSGRYQSGPRRLVLDCAEETGMAVMALRSGIRIIRSSARRQTLALLQAFAAANGGEIDDEARPSLDLAQCRRPKLACQDWLSAWASSHAQPPVTGD